MEDMDDFGDLYTDFDVHAGSGVDEKLYIGVPDDPIDEDDHIGDETADDEKTPWITDSGDIGDPSVDYGSDSEDDDLHIVLNGGDIGDESARSLAVNGGGNGEGDGCVSRFSQSKCGRAFPSNPPLPFWGDEDVEGGNRQKIPCLAVAASCNLHTASVSQKESDFHLPRNLTILDVGIEEFQWKPWRNPGVDLTDFFNFGLDEESWTHYCNCLKQFQEQAAMNSKLVYESSKPNQPKGRAIQVEGSSGERIPSIDKRHSRFWDTDSVIQIKMEEAAEKDNLVCNKVNQHVVDGCYDRSSLPSKPDSKGQTEAHDSVLNPEDADFTDSLDCETSLSRVELGDWFHRKESPSYIEYQTGKLEDQACNDMDKVLSTAEKLFLSSDVDIQECSISSHFQSPVSRICTNSREENCRGNKCCEQSTVYEEEGNYNSMKLGRMAFNVEEDSNQADGECHHMKLSWRTNERQNDCGSIDEMSSTSLKETELSSFPRSRRLVDMHVKEISSDSSFHRKKGTSFREDKVDHSRRKCLRKNYAQGLKDSTRENDITQRRDCYYSDAGRCGDRPRLMSQKRIKRSIGSMLECPYAEKDYLLRRSDDIDRLLIDEPMNVDGLPRLRQKGQFILGRHGESKTLPEGKMHNSQWKNDRHVSHVSRKTEGSLRRANYYHNLNVVSFRSSGRVDCDANYDGHPDDELLPPQIHRESHAACGRGLADANPPQYCNNWRANELAVDHQLHKTRDTRNGHKERGHINLNGKKSCVSSYRENNYFGEFIGCQRRSMNPDGHGNQENKRYYEASECVDKDVGFGHQGRNKSHSLVELFPYEKISKLDDVGCDHDLINGREILHEQLCCNLNRTKANRHSSYCEVRKCVNEDRQKLKTLDCRDFINLHSHGWEGKFSRRRSKSRERRAVDEEQNHFRQSIGVDMCKEVHQISDGKIIQALYVRSSVDKVSHHVTDHCSGHNNENWVDKYPVKPHEDSSEIEEGQIIEDDDNKFVPLEDKRKDLKNSTRSDKLKTVYGDKVLAEFDNDRILETLAKMEKRRERFKEPMAFTKALASVTQIPQPEFVIDSIEAKQQRPARKRRWGGS